MLTSTKKKSPIALRQWNKRATYDSISSGFTGRIHTAGRSWHLEAPFRLTPKCDKHLFENAEGRSCTLKQTTIGWHLWSWSAFSCRWNHYRMSTPALWMWQVTWPVTGSLKPHPSRSTHLHLTSAYLHVSQTKIGSIKKCCLIHSFITEKYSGQFNWSLSYKFIFFNSKG